MTKRQHTASGDGSPVPALTRGLDILRLFKRTRPVITAPEMARELGIPRSTVHRLAQVLETMGFLQRTNGGRDYTLGPAVLTIGFEYLGSLDVVGLAEPVLMRLRDDTGYSAHLVTRNGTEIVYLSRYPGRTTISSSISVGATLPAHATVIGRVLLSDLPPEELRGLYPGPALERHTDQTPATPAKLEAMLAEDRRRGYVAATSFFEPGLTTVAAPVRDRSGKIIAAISITALGLTIPPEVIHGALKDRVCAAAAAISAMLDAPSAASGAAAQRKAV
ncbi:MAG: IclR family transcriptional regulator [Alphaproteobacteria bacterium]|nr:IclR family transcriptional regulator [Alphaproteobacteria bacterium]